MDIEMIKCECCGLKEECTQDYITEVKAKFDVRDEVTRENKKKKKIPFEVDEAMKAHMSQILRRRSGNNLTSSTSTSTSTPKKYTRSASTSQVGHLSTTSFTLY
ncbi:hypothetical protein MKW98_030592 [Papaver atlanticum]|uniref:Uncharacterized protein n=1 Tax=Papaver atlanticum TaxID=357466 RepID=A0AAD4SKT8_9MAGN|nr:hypothetical protein MKW98_030592 [Papaver atlanticum]